MTTVLVRVGRGEGNRKTESTSLGMLCEYPKASVAGAMEDGERPEVGLRSEHPIESEPHCRQIS